MNNPYGLTGMDSKQAVTGKGEESPKWMHRSDRRVRGLGREGNDGGEYEKAKIGVQSR
jgi:hypothetical protein